MQSSSFNSHFMQFSDWDCFIILPGFSMKKIFVFCLVFISVSNVMSAKRGKFKYNTYIQLTAWIIGVISKWDWWNWKLFNLWLTKAFLPNWIIIYWKSIFVAILIQMTRNTKSNYWSRQTLRICKRIPYLSKLIQKNTHNFISISIPNIYYIQYHP